MRRYAAAPRIDRVSDMIASAESPSPPVSRLDVEIPPLGLNGLLRLPDRPLGAIVFAHGSGSSRFSPRNNHVAEALGRVGFASLLFDLLATKEETDRANVFDIDMLAERLVQAIDWAHRSAPLGGLDIGLFGASTGSAAALVAAAARPDQIGAVVSRGGRPDLALPALDRVRAPTLLLVGSLDTEVLRLNEIAYARLPEPKSLKVVPGATHLFSEPGALDAVVAAALVWFRRHLVDARSEESADALQRPQ